MIVAGIDLAGPANAADTALAVFRTGSSSAALWFIRSGLDDGQLFAILDELIAAGEMVAGLDAPLSYQPGGGDRPGDRRLRQAVQAAGLGGGTVMPPTLTRMIYLTVRGMTVARYLNGLPGSPAIVEVHPAAAMVLRGAPATAVRAMKNDPSSRQTLLAWLSGQKLEGVDKLADPGDHLIAALAAALGAWQWALGKPVWLQPARPPHHPFPYVA